MMCDNTIGAGSYFMMGKFLFDAAVLALILLAGSAFWLAVAWFTRVKK